MLCRSTIIESPRVSYNVRDLGSEAPDKRKVVLEDVMVPERLVLKKGAQVLLVKNVSMGVSSLDAAPSIPIER